MVELEYIIGYTAMTKPSNFIIHSGYASLKSDETATMSLSVLANYTIPAFGEGYLYTDLVIGTQDASLRGRGRVAGGTWYPGIGLAFQVLFRYDTITMPDVPLWVQANIQRVNPTTVRLYMNIQNPTNLVMRIQQTKTIEFRINTFISPFQ